MPRILIHTAVFVSLAALASAVSPHTHAAAELRVAGHRLFVPITINGVATEALLDSGAEMTLVDSGFARRLGLTPSGSEMAKGTGAGQAPVRFARGVNIQAAGTRLADRTVAILDLSDVAERLVGEPVHVVLGRDLFDSGRFVLDISAERFEPAPAGEPAGEPSGVLLPLTDHAGIKQMPVTLEGVATVADFDLGNGSEVLVGQAFADSNGWLVPERIVGTAEGGGIGGAIRRDMIELASLTLAGRTFTGVPAAIDPTAGAVPANIGVSVLKHFRLTIDFPANRLWLEPLDP